MEDHPVMEQRIIPVLAPEGADRVAITFPYAPAIVEAVREIRGRRWDPESKRWIVPVASAVEIASFVARTSAQVEPALLDRILKIADSAKQSLVDSRATDADAEIPVPAGLSYLPYQKAGIAYASSRPSTLIGDEMGLGKTIQAIGVVNADPSIKRVAVICPASLKINWKREITKWSTRPTQVVVGNGGAVGSWGDLFTGETVQWFVVNYDVLNKWRPVLVGAGLDLLVLDEAHYIKNPKAQRTVAILGKWDRDASKRVEAIMARRRIALTGTPILNRPSELWNLCHSFAPDTFKSWRTFMTRYANAYETQHGWDTSGASNLGELQTLLRQTIMVRRLKADVLTELPAKRRAVVVLPAPASARAAIEGEQAAYEAAQQRLTALRQAVAAAKASADPAAYRAAVDALSAGQVAEFTSMSRVRHEVAVSKVPMVIEHLRDAVEQGKVICFAWHTDVIKAIAAEFGTSAVTLTGETPQADRQAAVDRFQSDPTCTLFVGNIKAAGVGLTLTASSHVVFAELDWVPGNITQAEDRAHRIGQVNSVLIQHLVLDGSLDVRLAEEIVAKQAVADQALDREIAAAVKAEPIVAYEAPKAVAPIIAYAPSSATPDHGEAEEGMYRSPDGTIWKVQTSRTSGNLYAKRLVVGNNSGTFEYVAGAYRNIDPAWRMTVEEAAEFGKRYGFCCVCGRMLTDDSAGGSIERGIGPVCGGRI